MKQWYQATRQGHKQINKRKTDEKEKNYRCPPIRSTKQNKVCNDMKRAAVIILAVVIVAIVAVDIASETPKSKAGRVCDIAAIDETYAPQCAEALARTK